LYNVGLSFFSTITANDRGYGHLAVTVTRDVPFAGAFAVVKRQSECGSKTAGMHVSQPMRIGVCYQLAVGCEEFVFRFFASGSSALRVLSLVLLFVICYSVESVS